MADTSLLPIGSSSFEAIRKRNHLYVDKTEFIYQLASQDAPILLSRPRRFGKSLLLSTFKSLFAHGTRDFKGLWIEDKWTDKTYRVLHLDFSSIHEFDNNEKIIEKFNECIESAALDAGLSLDENDYLQATSVTRFTRAIFRKLEPNSTVLLIDEYDAPLTHNLDNPENFEKIRRFMAEFYSITKTNNGLFRFVFITGITRYHNTSIFSAFNNLTDISLNPRYAALLGYTEEELKKYFMPYIEDATKVLECTTDEVLASLKVHYDGYRFSPNSEESVYTPWSILNFMRRPHHGYKGYWYESGGLPTIVVKYMQSDKIQGSLDKLVHGPMIHPQELSAFNSLADMPLNILMYQAGYLTISGDFSKDGEIQLVLPNIEVKESLFRLYSTNVLKINSEDDQFRGHFRTLHQALEEEDAKKIADLFSYVLNNVSYQTFQHENSIRDVILASCFFANLSVSSEVATAKGRSDLLLTYNKHRYVFEFKRQRDGQDPDQLLLEAKEQIISRNYQKLQPMHLPVTAFAMVIDSKAREVVRYEKI